MRRFAILSLLLFSLLSAYAQHPCAVDSTKAGELSVGIDALAFFRDNEYDSYTVRGYSLPGTWVRPTLSYNPTENIHLEVGAHALFFDGANKYPCYAYHDIGHWKGNQYQDGAHALPWFRAQMDFGKVSFVLGDIYGDLNHGFATPMYNHEQLLSADPEMGFQILHQSKRFTSDLFLNWQSYQFEEDTHQEAFTVGLTSRYRLGNVANPWRYNAILQALLQHRGGEQDITHDGVQTLYNGLVGFSVSCPLSRVVSNIEAEVDALGCYQQTGHLWDFNQGLALHGKIGITMWQDLHINGGYLLAPKQFISLYGSPFFSTANLKTAGENFPSRSTTYLSIDYAHTFAGRYTFGANAEFFHSNNNKTPKENVFSFGVFMRVRPSFVIAKTKRQ